MKIGTKLSDFFNLLQEINELDSDLYVWIHYYGSIDNIDIDIARYNKTTNEYNGDSIFRFTTYDLKNLDSSEIDEMKTTLEKIKREEIGRIDRLAKYKALKEEFEGE